MCQTNCASIKISVEINLSPSSQCNPLSSRASIPTAAKIVSQNNQIVKVLRPNLKPLSTPKQTDKFT